MDDDQIAHLNLYSRHLFKLTVTQGILKNFVLLQSKILKWTSFTDVVIFKLSFLAIFALVTST